MDMFLDQNRNVMFSRAVTANIIIRRSAFELLGGFDESLPSGGDYEFLHISWGRGIAFSAGWLQLLVIFPGSLASVSVATA